MTLPISRVVGVKVGIGMNVFETRKATVIGGSSRPDKTPLMWNKDDTSPMWSAAGSTPMWQQLI
jgi:hypothetical protein